MSEEKTMISEIWYNLPDYSIIQAINLASGIDPETQLDFLPSFGKAIQQLIESSIASKALKVNLANIEYFYDRMKQENIFHSLISNLELLPENIDYAKTRIAREDLISLLHSHGLSFPPHGSGLLDEKLREEIKKINLENKSLKQELSQLKKEAYLPIGEKLRLALEIEREYWVPWLNRDLTTKPTEKTLTAKYETRLLQFSTAARGEIMRVSKPEQANEINK